MPRLLVFALTLCCLLSGLLPASAQDLARVVENVKTSLAKVIAEDRSVGTAFIVYSSEARVYLLTNCHVVGGSQKVEIVLVGGHLRGQAMKARVVGCDTLSDLAVVELVPDWLITEGTRPPPALRFADPHRVRVGDRVMTFGFAVDLAGEPSVNSGIISALNRSHPSAQFCASLKEEKKRLDCVIGQFGGLIQTDATINHGNSGGPMTNAYGEVVGVSTYTTTVEGPFNIFYARSVSTAAPFAKMLMDQGTVSRFDIGDFKVQTSLPDPSVSNLSSGGVRVSMPLNERAVKAGLRLGDVITRIVPCHRVANGWGCFDLSNDCQVSDVGSLFNCLALVPKDAPIRLAVFNPDPKCKDSLGSADCTLEKLAGRDVIFYPK